MKPVHATVGLGLFLGILLYGEPLTAWAQGPAETNDERTFGIASSVSHTLQAFAFTASSGNETVKLTDLSSFRARSCFGAKTCTVSAPLLLPAGAVVTSIQLEGCATSSSVVDAQLDHIGILESSVATLALITFGRPATTTCGLFTANVSPPHTIDNATGTYLLTVDLLADSGTVLDAATRFQAVRVFYHLQVSPPPATATFNDVPTSHPFFPFVQALVAAGITTGCSSAPPLYCPDTVVTRGQLAAFLSKALGLHWGP